jgi:uncharacterized alkaline shock family protein YloU
VAETTEAHAVTDTGAVSAPVAPEVRGTLDVRVKALEHVVEEVVRQTPGTVSHTSTLRRLVRGGTPSASTTVHAGAARLDVRISCTWPCDVTRIATDVRERVLAETQRMTGVEVRSVDVAVEVISPDDLDDAGSRRVE